jgi:hypothetical protein
MFILFYFILFYFILFYFILFFLFYFILFYFPNKTEPLDGGWALGLMLERHRTRTSHTVSRKTVTTKNGQARALFGKQKLAKYSSRVKQQPSQQQTTRVALRYVFLWYLVY